MLFEVKELVCQQKIKEAMELLCQDLKKQQNMDELFTYFKAELKQSTAYTTFFQVIGFSALQLNPYYRAS